MDRASHSARAQGAATAASRSTAAAGRSSSSKASSPREIAPLSGASVQYLVSATNDTADAAEFLKTVASRGGAAPRAAPGKRPSPAVRAKDRSAP